MRKIDWPEPPPVRKQPRYCLTLNGRLAPEHGVWRSRETAERSAGRLREKLVGSARADVRIRHIWVAY